MAWSLWRATCRWKIDAARAIEYVEDESERYAADFKFKVALSGFLLRRALWNLEGVPGSKKVFVRFHIVQ